MGSILSNTRQTVLRVEIVTQSFLLAPSYKRLLPFESERTRHRTLHFQPIYIPQIRIDKENFVKGKKGRKEVHEWGKA
jgi:hypothetical protein